MRVFMRLTSMYKLPTNKNKDKNKNNSNIFLVFMAIFLNNFVSSSSSSTTSLAPALFVFGDSLFDSGNNNFLPTIAKANYLPYGKDFDKGVTGRFTNGKTVADFIAEYLGLPYSPPYLRISSRSEALKGMNYASGSCGILPETGSQYGKCLNIKDQIELFERTVDKELKLQFKSYGDFSIYLSKSIFIFSIGSNDYLNNYMRPSSNTSQNYSPQSFAQFLVDQLALQFEKLYNLGARKVLMFELGPIGCIPSVTRTTNDGTECVKEVNELVSYFNDKLGPMLNNLKSTLQGSNFVLGRANWLGHDAIQNPETYGLSDTKNPCCTTWRNGTSACIPLLPACRGTNSHFFWDAYHPTESACSIVATRCFNDSSVCDPFIEKLAQM